MWLVHRLLLSSLLSSQVILLRRWWKPFKSLGEKTKKAKTDVTATAASDAVGPSQVEEETPAWLSFDSMKAAIDAGWRPGQSFSFVARQVKGQQLKDQGDVSRATPVGEPGFRPGASVDWNAN